jgi:hypothetical protein
VSGADHYEVLNVEHTATTAEIKSAYRRLVRQVHPDQGGNAALFRMVQEAWTVLSDPAKRAAYDEQLTGRPTASSRSGPSSSEQPRHDEHPRRDERPRYDEQPWPHEPPQADHTTQQEAETSTDVRRGAAGITVRPAFDHLRGPALLALAAWVLLVLGSYAATGSDSDSYLDVGIAAMVVLALPPHWTRRVPLRPVVIIACLIIALLWMVVMFPLPGNPTTTTDRLWIAFLLGGLVIVRVLTGRWSKIYDLNRTIDRPMSYELNVWGKPGEPLVDDGRTPRLPPQAVLRYRRTARILEQVVSTQPAAKLVHSARIGDVTVGHLVIAGSRVAVVDAMEAPPGFYTFDLYGSVLRDNQPFEGGDPGLQLAVSAWQARLKTAEVRGFLVMLPMVNGPDNVTAGASPDAAVSCLSAQSAAGTLGAWLGAEGDVLERGLLYDVLYRAPLDLR